MVAILMRLLVVLGENTNISKLCKLIHDLNMVRFVLKLTLNMFEAKCFLFLKSSASIK